MRIYRKNGELIGEFNRDNLAGADLTGADMTWANLAGADLMGANLTMAELVEANLIDANLLNATLLDANMMGANLTGANLTGSDLARANLIDANLTEANLMGANLTGSDLARANLTGATLTGTCLDPSNEIPEADLSAFMRDDAGNFIGYRTKIQRSMNGPAYQVGQTYVAPWFSTSSTGCHPGLYIQPLLPEDRKGFEFVKVEILGRIHRAGDKYRCRSFKVLEIVCK